VADSRRARLRRTARAYTRVNVMRLAPGESKVFAEYLSRSYLVVGWGNAALLVELPGRWARDDRPPRRTVDLNHALFFGGATVAYRIVWHGVTHAEATDVGALAPTLAGNNLHGAGRRVVAVREDGSTRPLTGSERQQLAAEWLACVAPSKTETPRG